MNREYTKAELEEIVLLQLENLNAMHELINTMKYQNKLINKASRRLEEEIIEYKRLSYKRDSLTDKK